MAKGVRVFFEMLILPFKPKPFLALSTATQKQANLSLWLSGHNHVTLCPGRRHCIRVLHQSDMLNVESDLF
jgi:hypothetical protein